jgi:hypothetical protein
VTTRSVKRSAGRVAIAAALVTATVGTGAVLDPVPASASDYAYFTDDGVRIRSCGSTSCTVLGLGYRGDSLTAYCYAGNWIKITDWTTGVSGWSAAGLTVTGTHVWSC